MKDGVNVPSERTHFVREKSVSTLYIASVKTADKGMYQCFVHSEYGSSVTSAEVTLGGEK